MKYLRFIYHFLGSIYFAILLIASVALLTIAGTLIESKTDSHRYAAYFTYDNPFFALLLWCFFINILFSALRRWPFKMHHIPFLITHLGLLMILGGALIKGYFGTQGSMGVMEGSANGEIFEAGTYVVQVEKRDKGAQPQRYELKHHFFRDPYLQNDSADTDFHIEILNYAPHSYERLQTWIKRDQGYILGLKPFPVYEWKDLNQLELPISTKTDQWDVYAFRTFHPSELIRIVYLQGMKILVTNRLTKEVIYQGLLRDALQSPISMGEKQAKIHLSLEISTNGFFDPKLVLEMDAENPITVPLNNSESLLNVYESKSHLGNPPFAIDLKRPPALLLIEDEHQDVLLCAFDQYGRVHSQRFQHHALNPIIVYDKGFGGYAVQAEIPLGKKASRRDLENGDRALLADKFTEALVEQSQLAPPLDRLRKACLESHQGFADSCLTFLSYWNNSPGWLYPEHLPLPKALEEVFTNLSFSPSEQRACLWVSRVFQEIDPLLKQGKALNDILLHIKWPIEIQQDSNDEGSLLTLLTQQIFAAAELLPLPNSEQETLSSSQKAHLLSAYLRAYGIHWSVLAPKSVIDDGPIVLETPITAVRGALIPSKKVEDNLPLIKLRIRQREMAEVVTLTYDRHASGFRWPILDGEYLIRFQPKFKAIPYKLRVRNARQINYANSLQPYSYESDLLITDKRTKAVVEKTISMNHVHETPDGYRFYLANIFPPNETAVKQVQIVVNHDPAKYWLTYPGAMSLTAGIILLFWLRPYKK